MSIDEVVAAQAERDLWERLLSTLKDAETGKRIWVDTSDKRLRTSYKHAWGERKLALQKTFTRSGVYSVAMSTSEDYVKALMKLFKMRA